VPAQAVVQPPKQPTSFASSDADASMCKHCGQSEEEHVNVMGKDADGIDRCVAAMRCPV
jgi:hypothetical protein